MRIKLRIVSLIRKKRWGLLMHILLLAGAATMMVPFIWMVSTAFKPTIGIIGEFSLIPKNPTWDNFRKALEVMPLALFYFNTLLVTLVKVGTSLFFCALAGFAFAKLRFPFKEGIFIAILVTMMVPFQARLVPLYMMMHRFNLIDTKTSLIIPHLMSTFGVFLMRQSIEAIPNELIDAAKIDGYSLFGIFWHIVLPLSGTVLATLAIFTFVWSWRDFLWPLIMISSKKNMVIELGLAFFGQEFIDLYGPMMAGGVLAIIPILVFFLILRRQFVRGMTLSGLKGV